MSLKYKVQLLINAGWLDSNHNNGPSVMANPLPNHVGPNVNAAMEESGMRTKTRLDEVKSPMDVVYKATVNIYEGKYYYCQESCLNHTIRGCEKFKKLLQRMMD